MTPPPETTNATPPAPPAAPTRRTQEFFLGEGVPEGGTENLVVNLGPSHPAMHGIVRIVTELDGEQVVPRTPTRTMIDSGNIFKQGLYRNANIMRTQALLHDNLRKGSAREQVD